MCRISHFPYCRWMTVEHWLDNWRKDRSARRKWCACAIFCPPQIPHRLNPQVQFPVCCYYSTVEGLSSVVDASQEISLSDLPKLDCGSWSEPIPMAARSNAWVCGPLACWDCGFESRLGHDRLFLVSVVCCQVEVSATGRSLVQWAPTECGACLSVIKKPHRDGLGPLGGCRTMKQKETPTTTPKPPSSA